MLPIAHSQWQEHAVFGIAKALTATPASSVTRALYCPGRRAHGPLRQLPGQHKKGKRRVCHGFHGSSSSQDAGLPLVLRATPQMQSQMQWKTRFFPQGSRDTGEHGAHLLRRKVKGSEPDPGAMPHASHCKLLFARTEPIRSAPFSRAGNGRGPWQPQALS